MRIYDYMYGSAISGDGLINPLQYTIGVVHLADIKFDDLVKNTWIFSLLDWPGIAI